MWCRNYFGAETTHQIFEHAQLLKKYDQSIQVFLKVSVRSLVENQYQGKSGNKFPDRFSFGLMYGDLRMGWQIE